MVFVRSGCVSITNDVTTPVHSLTGRVSMKMTSLRFPSRTLACASGGGCWNRTMVAMDKVLHHHPWVSRLVVKDITFGPNTNFIEIAQVTSAKCTNNARTFKNTRPSQHPKPAKVVSVNSLEFSGNKWEFMLMDRGICKGRISSHTPTANAIIKSSHQVFGQILCTMLHGTTVRTKAELEAAFDDACAIATCVVFLTLLHREMLLEHWHLDVT